MSLFATKGDEIKELEDKKAQLIVENKKLNEQISQSRKLDYIRDHASEQGFVPIDPKEIQYLKIDK